MNLEMHNRPIILHTKLKLAYDHICRLNYSKKWSLTSYQEILPKSSIFIIINSSIITLFYKDNNTNPKNTVVVSACWYLEIPQSQCKDGLRILSIVISILSTIQQRPVNRDNFTWNFPKPNALIACTTVKVSVNKI